MRAIEKWRVSALALALLMLLAACGDTMETPTAQSTATDAPATAEEEAAPETTATPTPVPATPTATLEYPGTGPWSVSFETQDGITLSGTLYGRGERGVVLAPMYPGGPAGWSTFAERLAAEGYQALTFDLRGHGDSQGEANYVTAPDDVRAAVAFLREEETKRIMLMGADEGGMAAIKVAADDPELTGLAILSAPAEFEGLTVDSDDLEGLSLPTLWIGSRLDLTQRVEEMYQVVDRDDQSIWIYEGSSLQGTYIFEGAEGDDLTARLISFIENNFE